MKTKVFKKIGLLGLSSLATFAFASNVQAAGQCNYTNYYFFSDINAAPYYTDGTAVSDSDRNNGLQTSTYLPPLNNLGDATVDANSVSNIVGTRLCLKKNGSDPYPVNCDESWEVSDLWTRWLQTVNGNKVINYTNKEGESDKSSYSVKDSTTRYFVHGNWYKIVGGVRSDKIEGGYNLAASTPSALTSASFLPDTTLTGDPTQSTPYIIVTRLIRANDYNNVTGFSGCTLGNTGRCMLTPALYRITFTADCINGDPDPTPTPDPKYNATINYYYWDMVNDKKPTNPQKVPFKDSSKPNPFTRTDLANGYGKDAATKQEATILSPEAKNTHCKPRSGDESVTIEIDGNHFTKDVYYKCTYDAVITYCIEKSDGTCVPAEDIDEDAVNVEKEGLAPDGKGIDVKSPSIKNCKLKDSKQKTVTIKIDSDLSKATDFKEEVRYLCGEDIPDNPKTGIALIISAWVVGLGALGYSAYYFMNARKEENAEL